ncbi:TIGR01777 family oxidoreductase [Desulfonatronovibrio magnus]|uniref:TIGR01777 family oxidoreductase n=1 Tax=Desulfonatronovibrio magnus TaxID=698827 RepID=UPI0005EB3C34|nr:TIGR01777 family oxidoreductase [Desulfonatronovibrio magnus]
MNYFILGGTGFVGNHLVKHLVSQGDKVTALVRDKSKLKIKSPNLTLVLGDPLKPGPWQNISDDIQVVINLTGSPVMTNWTEKTKQLILSSRVDSTVNAISAIKDSSPKTFVCANAVGYFGPRKDQLIDDHAGPGSDFLSDVAVQWQEAAMGAENFGHRVVVTRFPAVLGPNGGALKQMLTIFKLGLGGKLGSGSQWFSWVHIFDLVRAMHFVSSNARIKGAINVCAPEPITNSEFTAALAKTLRRPAFFTVPGFGLKLLYGEVADMLLTGQRCVPRVLQESGFDFKYPDIDSALAGIMADWQ